MSIFDDEKEAKSNEILEQSKEADLNKDNVVDDREHAIYVKRLAEKKKMGWTALVSMILVVVFLFSPFVSDTRITSMADIISTFFFAMAGIVAAYLGVSTWLSKSK